MTSPVKPRNILGDRTPSLEETVERLLGIGQQRFDLELGSLVALDGTTYPIVAGNATVEPDVSLPRTLCRLFVRTVAPVELPDTVWGPSADELEYPFANLGSFFGDDIAVGRGWEWTVWFGSERPCPAFSPTERAVSGYSSNSFATNSNAPTGSRELRSRPSDSTLASDDFDVVLTATRASGAAVPLRRFRDLHESEIST